MILREDGDVETEGESDDDEMPPLEDASDVEVAYPVDGRLLVARRALSVQVKEGERCNMRIFSILDVISRIEFVV